MAAVQALRLESRGLGDRAARLALGVGAATSGFIQSRFRAARARGQGKA